MTGAVLGCLISVGLWLVLAARRRARRPPLILRVAPYVRDLSRDRYRPVPPARPGEVLADLALWAGRLVGETVGDAASVERRLDRLGSAQTVADFRLRQVVGGASGLAIATALAVWCWTAYGSPVVALLALCGAGLLAGIALVDSRLSREVRRHEEALAAEFPVVADLLALAVAAGEGPVVAMERIVGIGDGAATAELSRVLGDVRTGTPLARALDRLAARTGVAAIARFAEGMAVAVDRGTPLADVLRDQAADARDAARRRLMEAGGRREVAMMLPVVFLILPVTVVFAFFPGFVGLHLTTGR